VAVFVPRKVFSQASQVGKMKKLITQFEIDNNNTATYYEAIEYYKQIAKQNSTIQVNEFGMTDSGFPLHEVIITNDGIFSPLDIRKKGKAILFINNAIHPGEPCGVDASMMLTRDLIHESALAELLENTVV
jgi:hypothetical protein